MLNQRQMNSTEPSVRRFLDEAAAARMGLQQIAMDVAASRFSDDALLDPALDMSVLMLPEMTWALKHGRLEMAARLIELYEAYANATSSAYMQTLRVEQQAHEALMRKKTAEEELETPAYLHEEDAPVLRLSPAEAKNRFGGSKA
jgi:hypothetical protein